ncbi:MAG: hypothetical protein U0T82_11345 [Bacteroidales bacterium]
MYKYGFFNHDGTEFIITDPATPRAFDNFLWNDALFSSVHQTGVGFIDYQVGKHEAVQLLTGIGRICDFDVFGRDGLMSRLIFIRDNDTGEFWNVNWEPVKHRFESYRCTHGLGYSVVESVTNNLFSAFRIFVPPGDDPVELWTLHLNNKSKVKRSFSVFVYNQVQISYKWGFNSYGDMLFRSAWFDEKQNTMFVKKKPHISPHDYQTVFLTSNRVISGWDGSRDFFVGTYNQLNEPEAVIKGKCSNTPGSSDSSIAAVQFDVSLDADEAISIQMILGVTDEESKVEKLKKKYLASTESWFNSLLRFQQERRTGNVVQTPDEHFNRMLNNWIRHQTSYGAKWCRWGWMGYRDIVQHGYGVSSFDPDRTREILAEALTYQYNNGMALRGWNPVDEKPYSDSALWLVFTLISYLRETSNFSFLEEKFPYFDKGKGSVEDHITAALKFLEINKGKHQLCLIKYGDWNDSLTGVGKEGRGESVWLSMAYAEALKQMAGLYDQLSKPDKKEEYLRRYKEISDAVNTHAWDGNWYLRCFDDQGDPIGSHQNNEGKIFLNTQSWALIAGIAGKDRETKLLESCRQMLRTGMGYKLLAPTFFEFDPSIGRISCLQPGICENGTIYSHVNVWMILGLLRAGHVDEAYEAFRLFAPGYPSGMKDDPKQKMPPYIFANGYYGPDHRNNKYQMEFTWITGSVAWYYNVLWKEMIGIQPWYDGLKIEPRIPTEWNEIKVTRTFRGQVFNIRMLRTEDPVQSIRLNGELILDSFIPLTGARSMNEVEVNLPHNRK